MVVRNVNKILTVLITVNLSRGYIFAETIVSNNIKKIRMSIRLYFRILIRIICPFILAMAFSFVTPHLREFFGDIPQEVTDDSFDAAWEWGVRHYWYFWMMASIILLSFINTALSVIALIEGDKKRTK